jgi:hypothetical protein
MRRTRGGAIKDRPVQAAIRTKARRDEAADPDEAHGTRRSIRPNPGTRRSIQGQEAGRSIRSVARRGTRASQGRQEHSMQTRQARERGQTRGGRAGARCRRGSQIEIRRRRHRRGRATGNQRGHREDDGRGLRRLEREPATVAGAIWRRRSQAEDRWVWEP